jgi:hypothetical protein
MEDGKIMCGWRFLTKTGGMWFCGTVQVYSVYQVYSSNMYVCK